MMTSRFFSRKVSRVENNEEREKLPAPVYYVESPEDDTVLVGMDVKILHRGDETTVAWFDTVKERRMGAEAMSEDMGNFWFRRLEKEGGGSYRFLPMDLEIYNKNVKARLQDGKNFDSLEDLTSAFLETKKDA